MRVKVETVWGSKLRLMLTLPTGEREFINADRFGRKEATQALDLLEREYKYKRSSIRFDVK